MQTLWLDLETYSETPITHGTHAYAYDAEIMIVAFALDDEPVQVWDWTESDHNAKVPQARIFQAAFRDPEVLLYAHNSHFDRTVLGHYGYVAPIDRWRDTMVKAMAHSLPGSLGQLSEIFKLKQDKAKDKRGKDLVQLFCKPRPETSKIRRATRETHPTEWAQFVEYARLDIEAMREIDKKLPTWNYP